MMDVFPVLWSPSNTTLMPICPLIRSASDFVLPLATFTCRWSVEAPALRLLHAPILHATHSRSISRSSAAPSGPTPFFH